VNIPTLTADGFVLRAFREDDVPALAALHSHVEVMRFLSATGEPERRPKQAWDYIAHHTGHWCLRGYGKWALAEAGSDRLIGRVGYYNPPYEWPGLELGWTLAPEVWGRGLATKAARVALDWGFQTLGVDEIFSAIHPLNAASIRVAGRLGERHVRDDTVHGKPCQIHAISRSEWQRETQQA
jgi:RimJ/RimL family protein N-acetyltransferase